jgi:hypothetical protein
MKDTELYQYLLNLKSPWTVSKVEMTVAVGNVVQVLDGADPRFPLGLVGKVASVTTGVDGVTSAQLTKATLADVVQRSHIQTGKIELNSTNFVGFIAPEAVQALATNKPHALNFRQKGVVALIVLILFGSPCGPKSFEFYRRCHPIAETYE